MWAIPHRSTVLAFSAISIYLRGYLGLRANLNHLPSYGAGGRSDLEASVEAFVSDPWICLHNHWSDPDYDRIRRSKHSDLLSRWRLRLRSARIAHIGQPTSFRTGTCYRRNSSTMDG